MGRRPGRGPALSGAAPRLRFVAGDLDTPEVVALLREHVAAAYANSPPDLAYVLDLSELRDPAITFWSVWDGASVAGMAALKPVEPGHAEIKSMHVAAEHRRRGIGAAIVAFVVDEARRRGLARVSLETGGNAPFAAARAMYERAGFTPCAPFADYVASDYNRYYSMEL